MELSPYQGLQIYQMEEIENLTTEIVTSLLNGNHIQQEYFSISYDQADNHFILTRNSKNIGEEIISLAHATELIVSEFIDRLSYVKRLEYIDEVFNHFFKVFAKRFRQE